MIKGATFESKSGQQFPVHTAMIIKKGGQSPPKTEKHLTGANEKGGHLLSQKASTGSNGVAQPVPESFLPPTVQGISLCPGAGPTSAAARTAFPTPDAG